MKTLWRRLLIVGMILAAGIALSFTPVGSFFTLSTLQANRVFLKQFVDMHYALSVLVYMAVMVLVSALALPIGGLWCLVGGFVYGVWWGSFYGLLSFLVGTTISFMWLRYFVGIHVQERYGRYLGRFNRGIQEHAGSYILGLHIMTVIPAFVINVLASMTSISLQKFIVVTGVGIIPGMTIYAYAGQQLGKIKSMGDILEPQILAILVVLALLTFAPGIWRIVRERRQSRL